MCHAYFVLKHSHNATVRKAPLNASIGSTCDVLPLLRFHLWETVLFNTEDTFFLIDSPEERGRFAEISENVGHDVNFKVLNSSTNKIIKISNIRSTNDEKSPSLRANPIASPELIKSL